MTVDLQLIGQIVLGAFAGAVAGFLTGRHNNDERYWAFLLVVALVVCLGNAFATVPLNPVPTVLGVPGLAAFVLFSMGAMELGLWTGGTEAPGTRGRRRRNSS
jgi:hypothetical protein